MAVRITGVFSIKVARLHHARRTIEVMHVIVIELAIRVVPQLVIRINNGLVIMENLKVHAHLFAQHVHRRSYEFLQ